MTTARWSSSSTKRATRRWRWKSCARARSSPNLDRRPDRRELVELGHVRVGHADAPVARATGDQVRLVGAVDADDPAAGPVAELRVGGGAERVVAVRGRVLEAQLLADPEVTGRSGRGGLADADAGLEQRLALLGERERGAPAIHADLRIHAVDRPERGAAHPP